MDARVKPAHDNGESKTAGLRRPSCKYQIGSGSDRSGNPLLQLLLRRRADLTRGHLAALEDHQGRDRHHAVFRRSLRALVDVELHDLDLLAHRAGDLVERGSDHAAGTAPFGPEVDHDGALCIEHFGFEIGVRNLANGHGSTSFCWRGALRIAPESWQETYERGVAGSSMTRPASQRCQSSVQRG